MEPIAVISNFNIFPITLTGYFERFQIYDQSEDTEIARAVLSQYPNSIITHNSGHSLSHYFKYIIDNYYVLPDEMYFLKSNIIPRHINQNIFEHQLILDGFVPIFFDDSFVDKKDIAHLIMPGHFIERNNSWYVNRSTSHYFSTYNELLIFLFESPHLPDWVLFAPGANYRVTSRRIKAYPLVFWEFLLWIVTYEFFPTESYIVERMLYTIFQASYGVNDNFRNVHSLERILELLHSRNENSPRSAYSPVISKLIVAIKNLLR